MKILITLILILGLTTIGLSQRKLKKLDINEEGLSIKTQFQPLKDKIDLNGLSIKITPTSADNLNLQFSLLNQMNGKFDYSFFEKSRDSYFLKKQRPRRDKTDLEFLIEGLEWLVDSEKITDNEYNELFRLIYSSYVSESNSDPTEAERIISSNPYYLGSSYMNVFKIEFTNSTNNSINFSESLLVKSGEELLSSLSSDFLREELSKLNLLNFNKSLILERYNLEKSTLIPATSTITKYFAIPPLRIETDLLDIHLATANHRFSWKIDRIQNKIQREYSFYELAMLFKASDLTLDGSNYSILGKNSKAIAYLGDRKIFINSENSDTPIEILTISIYNDYIYFSRKADLKAANYIDLTKLKRSYISIESEKLVEIRRRK